MNVLKNTDIANKYNVSNATVTGWIQKAALKKINLQLEVVKNKFHVIDSPHNLSVMMELAEKGRKHRKHGAYKKVKASDEFYQIFNLKQQIEIFNHLKTRHEIPLKFTYLNGGARLWDEFYNKSLESSSYKTALRGQVLLENSLDFFDRKTKSFDKVNIIDIGPGNGLPLKDVVDFFTKNSRLNKYVALDISEEMLDICEKNVKSEFPKISFSRYNIDIENELLTETLFTERREGVCNLLFYFGDTIGNATDPIRTLTTLRYSIDDEDLLVISNKIEKEENKAEFTNWNKNPMHEWILNLFFNTKDGEVVKKFNEQVDRRQGAFKLNTDYEITFNIGNSEQILEFYAGDEIVFWSHQMSTRQKLLSDLDECGLETIHFTITPDLQGVLVACQVRKDG